jgi:topoisomerase IA-like protein
VGPYGPFVRELMEGEPTDLELMSNANATAAQAYYQQLWADDASFIKTTERLPCIPLPAEMIEEPSVINGETLARLLDVSTRGDLLGKHPETGKRVVVDDA